MTRAHLELNMQPQPDDSTCGPTCLQAVYRYYGDDLGLPQVITEIPALEEGGTLAVLLGCHALQRGYRATIYTYNLTVFDPTWFADSPRGKKKRKKSRQDERLIQKLQAQIAAKDFPKLRAASAAYIEFLKLGGEMRMEDLNAALLRRYFRRGIPILTGLSATYLYRSCRELADTSDDDIAGSPAGHFVVLSGYEKQTKTVRVSDPYLPNPLGEQHDYEVALDRLICAVLLGVLTYDANLLIIEPLQESMNGSREAWEV